MPTNDDIDDLDEKARNLHRMLRNDDASKRPTGPTPTHPLVLACGRWRDAINRQDIGLGVVAAQRVYELLQGRLQRPALKSAYEQLHFINPLLSDNLYQLALIVAHVLQSEG